MAAKKGQAFCVSEATSVMHQVMYMTAAQGEPLAALARLLQGAVGGGGAAPCGIVYTARREDAEAVAGRLRSEGALPVWD